MFNKIVDCVLGIAAVVAISLAVIGVICKVTGFEPPKYEPAKEVCTVRFGNYVRATDGLYAGFEGWIVSKDGTTVTVKLNDDSVPVEYIRRAVPEYRLATRQADSTEMVFLVTELKDYIEPFSLTGTKAFTEQLMRSVEHVTPYPSGSWRKGEPVRMLGRKWTVAVMVQDDTPSKAVPECDRLNPFGRCNLNGSSCGCNFDSPVKLFDPE